ncbi:MAG: hypothetical protein ABL921_13250 [Pirellula sp.]
MSAFSNLYRLLVVCALIVVASANGYGQVAFDVNPLVSAREANPMGLMSQMPNSRMVEVQLDVSALFTPGDAAVVTEYTVRIVSRHEEVQVADYSPRTELQSEIFGAMQVNSNQERVREAAIRGMGGYPGVGSAQGYAYYHDNQNESVHYAKKPALELVNAAGTLERRRGVYFKVRQSSQTTLEGARPFRVVFEVPYSWRADLLDVTIDAAGLEHAGAKRPRVLSSQQFVVAMYQELDDHAARAARNYVRQQESLNHYAKTYARTIEQRSFPTPIHKLGAKLDIYEPSIPKQWLETLIYQQGVSYNLTKLSSLPVDVRVAIMNYLDQKHLIESMSATRPTPSLASRDSNLQDFARR